MSALYAPSMCYVGRMQRYAGSDAVHGSEDNFILSYTFEAPRLLKGLLGHKIVLNGKLFEIGGLNNQ